MTSFVYFVQAGPGGPVKIGKADNVEKRVIGLQTGCPDRLEVLGVIECDDARAREKQLHERFSSLRIDRSEWFRWSPAIAYTISAESHAYTSQRSVEVSAVALALGLPLVVVPDRDIKLGVKRTGLSAWSVLYRWLREAHGAGTVDDRRGRMCTLHNRTRVGDLTMMELCDIECVRIGKLFKQQRGRAAKSSELRDAMNWTNLNAGPMTTDPTSGRHLTGSGLFVLSGKAG